MDTILFADVTELASSCLQVLADGSNFTKIKVEESADEDNMRFTIRGYQAMYLDTVFGSGSLNIDAWTYLQKSFIIYSSDLTIANITAGNP